MQDFWSVSTLVVLVESLQTRQPAVVMSMLVRPQHALLRVGLLYVRGATMAALGQGVLASADRHGSVSVLDVGEGFGDGAPVVASDVGVVPGVVSHGAGGFF